MNALLAQIETLQKLRRWQDIINQLRPLVNAVKPEAWVLRYLGFAYSQLDQYDEARFCYKQWIELEPDSAQPYYHVGFTFYDAGDWNQAIEWFDLALERFPDYHVCLYRKGVALFMARKTKKAKETLKKAIVIYQNSNNPKFRQQQTKYYYRSIFYLGKCYLQIGSYKNARACFEKIIDEDKRKYIDPLYVKYNLAFSFMRLKHYFQAEQIVKQLVQIKPRAEWLYDFWGRLLIEVKKYPEAIEKFDYALKIRRQPYILVDRARAYYLNEQKQLAKADLHEALKRDRKGKHKILLELAKIALKEKQFNQAIMYARRAIEFKKRIYESDYAEAHVLLSDVYKATGKNKEAQQELNIAQHLCPQMEWDEDVLLKSRIIL